MEIKINLPIDIRCPNCSSSLCPEYKDKYLIEEENSNDYFFNIFKNATLKKVEDDFFREVFDKYSKRKAKAVPKSVEMVRRYFNNLKFTIINTNEPRELLKISNRLVKARVIIKKDVQKEVNKQKKQVLALVKNKVKKLRKKKRK